MLINDIDSLKMIRLLLTFILPIALFSVSSGANSLSLSAEVDRQQLASNESLRLIVTADESATAMIDFSELLLQFDIVNTQRSNQTSIANGKVSASTQWILILSPKELGRLVIPSFEYKGVYSQAITVNVSDTPANAEKTLNKDVFLQLSVNKNTIYVQEQLLVTIKLYYKTALSSYDDEALQLENTTVTLVSENNFRSDVKGTTYNVLEKTYALHPQASGAITIPAQSWRLEKALNRFNFGRSGNPYLYVRSASVIVDVQPIADESTADTWLPSTAVTLDAKWKQSIVEAKLGEPINYQLILIANGLTAAQLPEISLPESDKFTIYSDQADINNNKSSVGIIGTRVNNFAVIPRETGSFTFPGVSVKWWNTMTNRQELAQVDPQTIIVVNPSTQDLDDKLPTLPSTEKASDSDSSKTTSLLWQSLTLLFFAACILLGYLMIRTKKSPQSNTELNRLTNQKNGRSQTIKRLKKQIEMAVSDKDWGSLRMSTLQLGAFITEQKNIHSLNELSQFFPEIKTELQRLDDEIYGKKSLGKHYDPSTLVNTLLSLDKVSIKGKPKGKLKELYPR